MTTEGLLAFLEAAVRSATGGMHTARTAQREFAVTAYEALLNDSEAAASLPTGVGKSLIALSVAGYLAAEHSQRTVIATETIALQTQYAKKDAIDAIEAAYATSRQTIKVATLKGYSNYACGMKAIDTMQNEFGFVAPGPRVTDGTVLDAITFLKGKKGHLASLARRTMKNMRSRSILSKDQWHGPQSTWDKVSISSDDCLQRDCPLIKMCSVKLSRKEAAQANVIITNHAMIASQAAHGLSTFSTGPTGAVEDRIIVHNVIIDEAHALASAVRGQATKTLEASSILDAVVASEKALPSLVGSIGSGKGRKIALDFQKSVEASLLSELRKNLSRRGKRMLQPPQLETLDYVPRSCRIELARLEVEARSWLSDVAAEANRVMKMRDVLTGFPLLDAANKRAAEEALRVWQRVSRIQAFLAVGAAGDIGSVTTWLFVDEKKGQSPALGLAQCDVNTARMLEDRVWNMRAPLEYGSLVESYEPVGRIAISATLSQESIEDVGFSCKLIEKDTPFEDAYSASKLFIPGAYRSEPLDSGLLDSTHANSGFLDAVVHREWVMSMLLGLIGATSGGVLLLSGRTDTARGYADFLRTRPVPIGRQVLSQWDDKPLGEITNAWKADNSAVLVGTKSLMTGIDAPGETCSLVILDRVPYAGKSAINKARERLIGGSKEHRRLKINVADACILIEQALGRLIRHPDDIGMFALLDPRVTQTEGFYTPLAERQAYLHAVRQIAGGVETPVYTRADAVAWLRGLSAKQPMGLRGASPVRSRAEAPYEDPF